MADNPKPSAPNGPSTSDAPAIAPSDNLVWTMAIPGLLVWLWSTGFIGAKYGLAYAEPFTISAIRFGAAAAILAGFAWIMRAPWPKTPIEYASTAVTGILLHGIYMVGVFIAIYNGTPAWIASLLTGLHPMLTAILAGMTLGERIRPWQWLGFILGLLGIALIVWRDPEGDIVPLIGAISLGIGLMALTGSTLFQKRFGTATDLRSGQAIQLFAACLFVIPGAFLFEAHEIDWTLTFVAALAWLTVGLSIGMITLLYLLIRRGAASKVASLFYLVPPVTAVEGYFLFGEIVTTRQIAGMVLAGIGVALVTRTQKNAV